ncbi:MAG TPA: type VI secretion system contractile sheath large subunit [Rhizobiaceae bacterium]|nr:type VI secretion system contractile sheath large subunit [Rhizobiaceae bacterium]
METGYAVETSDADPQAGSAGALRGAPARPALRGRVVTAAQDSAHDEEALDLRAFLEEEEPIALLRRWFGVDALLSMSRRDADSLRLWIDRDIAVLDRLLSEQLDAILHHRQFKELEAAWRGVMFLLDQVEGDERIIIRVLAATWKELERDFDRANEFDQSALFAKVYSEEYGMPGGLPYGLLLCDYSVRHRQSSMEASDDIGVLSRLAEVAAASFSPCVVGAAPELFGVSTFAELSHVQSIDAGFRLAEYQRWRRLQRKEESRFLGVTLPRILLRYLHDGREERREGFVYREQVDGIVDWLWGNAVYGFGAVAIRAFRESGWFADIRGARESVLTAGRVDGLPAPLFSTGETAAYRRPLEVELTDEKQKVLEELGFIALSPCSYAKSTAFLGAQSLNVPQMGDTAESRNARLSSMLQYVLCVSRFAHYVKVIARDRVGSFTTAAELERLLGDWLRGYMLGNPDASSELKARYPLSGGSVSVTELPGKPGSLACILHIEPHFQFDQIVTGLKLRTEIQATRSV